VLSFKACLPALAGPKLGISFPVTKGDKVLIMLTVNHKEFDIIDWPKICHNKTVVYDVQGTLDR
jgi:hypothetical protein